MFVYGFSDTFYQLCLQTIYLCGEQKASKCFVISQMLCLDYFFSVKMKSKCSQNAVKMWSKCGQNAVKIQSKCSQNSVKMQPKAVKMQSKRSLFKCSQNAAKFQSKCSQNSVTSRSAYSFQSCISQSKFEITQ